MNDFARLNQHKIKLGLTSILQIEAELGYPSRSFSSIHIAGTNGKGSVSTKIAYALMYSGKKVGLYTSPHLLSFQERIGINGKFIEEEELMTYWQQVEMISQKIGLSLTFFEILTLIAFLYFAHKQIEVAVIEVGMGGRLDATNIIHPTLSVITSIDYDHKEYLGDTLEKIAYEKAGIIKPCVPLILGSQIAPISLLKKIAKENNSPYFLAEKDSDFDSQNKKIAALALEHTGYEISTEAKNQGLQVRPPCRFQVLQKKPPIILDVAHNEAGLEALFHKVSLHFPSLSIIAVAAFSCPHKALSMARYIQKKAKHSYFTKADHERSTFPPHVEGSYSNQSVEQALTLAQDRLYKEGGLLLVTGTFFMMPEVFTFFGVTEVKGPLFD